MPFNSGVATAEKRRNLKTANLRTVVTTNAKDSEKGLLKIAPALPIKDKRSLYVRSHSSLNANSIPRKHENSNFNEAVVLQAHHDGLLHVSRVQTEKETQPDRLCLDRRGLSAIPIIEGEPKLRLLSLQHNLICNLDTLRLQQFPSLVFLDIYDNQLEKMQNFDHLENLRVLLMGKNRIKKIEGLDHLTKIEVLDLHGNQITQVSGLGKLKELKVLNLAGNQIRNIGTNDLYGLHSLQELNLRRNRLRKLLGFSELPNLSKLFISNNDLQCIDDISSLAKSTNIKEISIDNNPIFLEGDCISFLVSYLPQLTKLNTIIITEQVRKAAMAWRRNKEITNATYMELTSDISLNYRREEVISNARTNWELLRSQTKCLTSNVCSVDKTLKDLKPDSDFVLTSLAKMTSTKTPSCAVLTKSKTYTNIVTKVPILSDKKAAVALSQDKKVAMAHRTSSQDTDNSSQNTATSTSNNSSNEIFKLPPILVPILNKMDQKNDVSGEQNKSLLRVSSISGSLSSSVGPNVDSSISSLTSDVVDNQTEMDSSSTSSSSSSSSSSAANSGDESDESEIDDVVVNNLKTKDDTGVAENDVELSSVPKPFEKPTVDQENTQNCATDTSSVLSVNTTTSSNISLPISHHSSSENSSTISSTNSKSLRNVKSAVHGKSIPPTRSNIGRAATAKAKKQPSPNLPKDREQGGDYLIEICGRHLNIYGQGALRFIDKPWNANKALDVNLVKFNYVNFNSIVGFLGKLKHRFPNVDSVFFKETNITCLGQLNALSALQGIHKLHIDSEGNPICDKEWETYAVYRLSHWGLKVINNREINDEEIQSANAKYQSLNDLILWSLPDVLLQPLLMRLRIDVNHNLTSEQNAKKWLITAADPELRSVVCKEVLQWKKMTASPEEVALRHKAKQCINGLLKEMTNAMDKLVILEKEWPNILHSFVQNTLFDYSQLDLYMKQKMQEFNK